MIPLSVFPHFAAGPVVKGFGRGSKELGIPTANFPCDVVTGLPKSVSPGIYYGLAKVLDGPVHKMVMSVGWNPYYQNRQKSMETHILHEFSEDFYGSWLRVAVLGYIRPERNFSSLAELITAIRDDIAFADRELSSPLLQQWSAHPFLGVPVTDLQRPGAVDPFNRAPLADCFSLPLAVMDPSPETGSPAPETGSPASETGSPAPDTVSPAPDAAPVPDVTAAAPVAKEGSKQGVESGAGAPQSNGHMSNGHGS